MLRSETLNKQEQWVVDGLVGRPARLRLSLFARALNVVEKSIFDSQTEKPRQGECMNEARIELARLAVVDGLPRDVKPLGKLALTPSALTTQLANLVLHRLRTACATARTAHTAAMTGRTTNMRRRGKPTFSRKPYGMVQPTVTVAAMPRCSRVTRLTYSSTGRTCPDGPNRAQHRQDDCGVSRKARRSR